VTHVAQLPLEHSELVDEPPPEVARALQAEIRRTLNRLNRFASLPQLCKFPLR
jgi:hypothetical protein